MAMALTHLAIYQYAGTIDGALAGINREAGIKETKADAVIADIEQYRTVTYAPDISSGRIRAWLYPGFVRYNDSGRPVDRNDQPINNDAQRNMLLDELDKLGLAGLPVATFLTSGTLGAQRAKVISRLQIP